MTNNARIAFAAVVLIGTIGLEAGARPPSGSPSNPYTLSVSALVGPLGTDVTLEIAAAPGAEVPPAAQRIQLETDAWIRKYQDIPLEGGRWTIRFTDLPRGSALSALVVVKLNGPVYHLRANTVALLLPELRFASVGVPLSTRAGDLVTVPVVIEETGGDLGATFDLVLNSPPTHPVTATGIRVDAGGTSQILLTTRFLQVGVQIVTLIIQRPGSGFVDPSKDSKTLYVTVGANPGPTDWDGGYTRVDGASGETFAVPFAGSGVLTTTGRHEMIFLNGNSSQPMAWPMDFSASLKADGIPVIEYNRTGINPTEIRSEGFPGSETLSLFHEVLFPIAILTVSTSQTSASFRTAFQIQRSSADYVQIVSINGGPPTTSLQVYGTFLNAASAVQFDATLTSSLNQFGGAFPVLPITHSRNDYDPDPADPNARWEHQDVWSAYGSGTFP
jgi:hypothetical protein